MPELDITYIEARALAATPGRWEFWTGSSWRRFGSPETGRPIIEPFRARSDGHPDLNIREADAEFVQDAREDAVSLCSEVRKLRAQLDRQRKASAAKVKELKLQVKDLSSQLEKEQKRSADWYMRYRKACGSVEP